MRSIKERNQQLMHLIQQIQENNRRLLTQLNDEHAAVSRCRLEESLTRIALEDTRAKLTKAVFELQRAQRALADAKDELASARPDSKDEISVPKIILEEMKKLNLGRHLRTSFHPDKWVRSSDAMRKKVESLSKELGNILSG